MANPASIIPCQWSEATRNEALASYTFIRRQLIARSPFYAVLSMGLQARIVTPAMVKQGCWCAATNGRHFYINPDGWMHLNTTQKIWVFKHEIMHCVLRHPTRLASRNKTIWNVACDIVVNMLITNSEKDLPIKGAYWDDRFKNTDADTIYQALKKEHGEQPDPCMESREEFAELFKHFGGVPHSTMLDPLMDPETGKPLGEEEGERLKIHVEGTWASAFSRAHQVDGGRGHFPAGIEHLVERENTPRLPWGRLLQQWVQARVREGYDWMVPNRRFVGENLYLPSRGKPSLGDIVVLVDTSGSVEEKLLSAFLGEVEGVLKTSPARVFLVTCDVSPFLVGVYENAYDFPLEIDIVGRGGTDFKPGVRWIEEHSGSFCEGDQLMPEVPKVAIYLTDGMGSYPDELPEGLDVLWVLSKNHTPGSSFYPPVGQAIIAFEDL